MQRETCQKENILQIVYWALLGFAPEVLIERSLEIVDSSVRNSERLLDGDDSTCINPQMDMIWNQTLYLITAKILTISGKGKIIAGFNDTVNCSNRQVNVWLSQIYNKVLRKKIVFLTLVN